jgi:hypothetical protein
MVTIMATMHHHQYIMHHRLFIIMSQYAVIIMRRWCHIAIMVAVIITKAIAQDIMMADTVGAMATAATAAIVVTTDIVAGTISN